MKITRNLKVPTGNICVADGEYGPLEMVSLGDYGKDINIKADFLGLTREIKNVEHGELLPLEEKWVATISSQYGCSMKCKFCDVPKVGPGRNATIQDLVDQVDTIISLHPEVKHCDRLNIHYARMGEPTFNQNIFLATLRIWKKYELEGSYHIHPVVSTMCPRDNNKLKSFIQQWVSLKNEVLDGEAGLQLSINSTDENERNVLFSGNASTLAEIADIMKGLKPKGRKFTLNFAVANFTVDPEVIRQYFDPERFMIKLTPMHKTIEAENNGIRTEGDYTTIFPYLELEEAFKQQGFDVLVFLASDAEDLGLITCGNAILSGTMPRVEYTEIDCQ